MSKINCMFHNDSTASLELYPDQKYHCFGCGKSGRISDLPGNYSAPPDTPREKENLADSIAHIRKLPVVRVRGLDLPCDGESYFIVWPSGEFYNRRFFEGGVKYKCPTGHSKKLLIANTSSTYERLVICEGEINALSIAKACPWLDVVSPGGAGDFYSKTGEGYRPTYLRYREIALVCDQDKAGAMAAIELKSRLLKHTPNVQIILMEKDANDILVEKGPEGLAEEIRTRTGWVEVSGRLPTYCGAV